MFPFKRNSNDFPIGSTAGSGGCGNESGWMNADAFYLFLQHFKKYFSKERPALLLMDNHESHLSIKGLDFLKENGVVVLTFPPHCTHRLQPLDRSVFAALKKQINNAFSNHLRQHPAIPITVKRIPNIIVKALENSFTPSNIISGFLKTGIYPLNPDIFGEEEFMPAEVTDRPLPEHHVETITAGEAIDAGLMDAVEMDVANYEEVETTPTENQTPRDRPSNTNHVDDWYELLEEILPYPKAGFGHNKSTYPTLHFNLFLQLHERNRIEDESVDEQQY